MFGAFAGMSTQRMAWTLSKACKGLWVTVSAQSLASTKNPFPPRNVPATAIPLRLFRRALHAFARGSVLFGEMLVFGAIPTGLQLQRARGLFFIGTADAFGHRCWCLAVPWGALPSLGIGGCAQRGQNQEQGEGFKTHGAKMRFVGRATRCNSVLRPQPNGGHRKNCEVFWLQATRCHRCTPSRQSTEVCQMFLRTTEVD